MAMTDDAIELDETDQALMSAQLSDAALEAAAGVADGRAITWIYCSFWHCWPA
jgi:hypothetical protein